MNDKSCGDYVCRESNKSLLSLVTPNSSTQYQEKENHRTDAIHHDVDR